ncbi:MAG: zinc ribbon domain-containing protein [Ignavibacteriaceae bacterium]
MEKEYKNCQSCGMPLSKDEKGGGTEKNGEKSLKYCSRCYQDGKFTMPDITVQQMQQRVKEKIKTMGMPGFVAGIFTRQIPKLERWKNA